MNFMNCTTCQRVVQANDIGICLGCQRGFVGLDQEDLYIPKPEKSVEELEDRKKQIEESLESGLAMKPNKKLKEVLENALQKPKAESLPTHQQAKDGSKVGSGDAKKRKKPKKKGKKKVT